MIGTIQYQERGGNPPPRPGREQAMILILSILALISAVGFRKRGPTGIGQENEQASENGAAQ